MQATAVNANQKTTAQAVSPTILLAEDDPSVRRLSTRLLTASGYLVTGAENGQDALDLAATQPVSLLLTDITMPKMNGVELAKRLLAQHPHLPVLIMSGNPTSGVAEVLRDGQVEFLQKPFMPAELLRRIQSLLGQRRDPLS